LPEFVLNSAQKSKCIKTVLAAGLRPSPLGSLQRSPSPHAANLIKGSCWGPREEEVMGGKVRG